jgi:hypothetical protein
MRMVALQYMTGSKMLTEMDHRITSKKMKLIMFGLVIIDLQLQEVMIQQEKLGELFRALEEVLKLGIGTLA